MKIVAADGEWDIIDDLLKDPDLLDVVDVIGYVCLAKNFLLLSAAREALCGAQLQNKQLSGNNGSIASS